MRNVSDRRKADATASDDDLVDAKARDDRLAGDRPGRQGGLCEVRGGEQDRNDRIEVGSEDAHHDHARRLPHGRDAISASACPRRVGVPRRVAVPRCGPAGLGSGRADRQARTVPSQ